MWGIKGYSNEDPTAGDFQEKRSKIPESSIILLYTF